MYGRQAWSHGTVFTLRFLYLFERVLLVHLVAEALLLNERPNVPSLTNIMLRHRGSLFISLLFAFLGTFDFFNYLDLLLFLHLILLLLFLLRSLSLGRDLALHVIKRLPHVLTILDIMVKVLNNWN